MEKQEQKHEEQGHEPPVEEHPHGPPPHEEHHGLHPHTGLHAGFRGGDIQKGREGWME